MPLSGLQSRSTYTLLFIIVLCGILWTGYFIGTDRDVFAPFRPLPSLSRPGQYPPPPDGDVGKPPGFPYHHAVDVTVPHGVKIIGLVFYGRRELVQILDCYLKRNLKDNGGLLDEVIFAVNTEKKDDLAYLEELVASNPRYKKHVATKEYDWYIGAWEAVSDPDAIYVKVDDDVVFFEDTTIPALVKRMLENPQYFSISANVINNPALSWVHRSMGVYEPYYPELSAPSPSPNPKSWRPSELPWYEGPAEGPPDFEMDGSTPAPYKGHRWLPVRLREGEVYDMSLFPSATLTYDAFGPSLHNWAAAAQTHYSFLQHLETGDIWRYKFDIWDYNYDRLSINFILVRGKDILDVFPFPQQDDEDYLTVTRPKELRKRVIVDGTALAVHFAFNPQYMANDEKAVAWTDALARYRAYADEMICPNSNRKV